MYFFVHVHTIRGVPPPIVIFRTNPPAFSAHELNQLKQQLNAVSDEKSDSLLQFTEKIKHLHVQLEGVNLVNARLEEDNVELAKTTTEARGRVEGLKKEVEELRQNRLEDREVSISRSPTTPRELPSTIMSVGFSSYHP